MQKASRTNQRDALIMIYSFNYGQYHLYLLISIPIHTVPKIRYRPVLFATSYTYGPRIGTGLFYCDEPIHMVPELGTGLY